MLTQLLLGIVLDRTDYGPTTPRFSVLWMSDERLGKRAALSVMRRI